MPGLPPDGALHGIQIDSMMVIIHIIMVVVFVGWLIYFVVALIRGASRKSPVQPGAKGARWAVASEVLIAAAEILVLVGLSIPFWATRVSAFPDERGTTVVRVVAEQYNWNIHYPGPDGVFGRTDPALVTTSNPVGLDTSDSHAKDDIVTLNDMHLPVGIPVIIYLTSKDVIHSFSIPLYRIKQDAIPGQRIPIWFTPYRTSVNLQREMVSRYAIDAADSSLDLSLLNPLNDIRDATGMVVLSAGTPLTMDARSILAKAGIREVDAAPSTPTEIACAQLCGMGHYRMKGYLTVESDSAFHQWMNNQLDASISQ